MKSPRRRTDCINCEELGATQCLFCRNFFCGDHAIAHHCGRNLFDWMRGFVGGVERGDIWVGGEPRDLRKGGPRGVTVSAQPKPNQHRAGKPPLR